MIINATDTNGWRSECTHIDVFRASALLDFNGEIDGHKIIEIEPLGNGYIAVKTIGWGRQNK